jgi:hypothetical protein
MAKRFIFSKLYRNLPRIAGGLSLLLGLATLTLGILVLLSSKGLITNIPLFEATLLNTQFIPIGSALIGVGALFALVSIALFVIQRRSDTRRRHHEVTHVIRDADSKRVEDSKKPYKKPQLSPESTVEEYSIASPLTGKQNCSLVPYSTDQETPFINKS